MLQPIVSDPTPWMRLIAASERLAGARSMDAVIDILRETARGLVGADGICVVLKEGDRCHYVAEDAMAPLWAGQNFPAETCVSGWAMIHRAVAVIPDIRLDKRIPQEAYAATFVKSMVMAPIGSPVATAAIGAYWGEVRGHYPETIEMMEALARTAAIAIENVRLLERIAARDRALAELTGTLEQRVEQRTTELLRTQEALRQSQKLEAMGQLTGGVAHDFNNLLTPIIGSLDLLHRRGLGDAREQRLVEGALQSAERARTLVQRLLAFARRQPLSPTAIDVAALLIEMSPLIGTTVGPQVEITLDIAEDLPLALADTNQIEMAVLNLAVNARDAMPSGGRLALSARREDVAGAGHAAGLAPGRYVMLGVSDSGIGMDEETLARAIEPFFSTKGVGKGTGLGLSMVHGLASQLGGGMAITSRVGIGTAVELWFPISEQPLIAEPLPPAAPAPMTGTALVVDDEDLVRAATAYMLGELGFVVIEARSGEEALALIESGRAVDLVVTDHLMPAMTGVELAAAVRAHRPDLGVLIVSGYAEAAGIAADVPHLEKPFRQAELAASIAAIVHRAAA